jgi:hypothetical protein
MINKTTTTRRTEIEENLTNLQRNINRIVRSNAVNEDREKEEIKLQTHTITKHPHSLKKKVFFS